MKDLENAKGNLEKEVEGLKQKLKSKDSTHQTLLDEHQALQAMSSASEGKISLLERENDQLVRY